MSFVNLMDIELQYVMSLGSHKTRNDRKKIALLTVQKKRKQNQTNQALTKEAVRYV